MRKIQWIAALGICLLLNGCAGITETEKTAEEEITLIEPVGDTASAEIVQLRDLYQETVYPAFVVPKTVEYAFENAVTIRHFDKMPGENVKKGDILVSGDTTSIDKKIEAMEEQIADLEKGYQEYLDEMYAIEKQTYRDQLNMINRRQQYELDHQYYMDKLALYERQRDALLLKADRKGKVVSVRMDMVEQGGYLGKDQVVAAIQDPTELYLTCDYIKKAVVAGAEEIYALINGERYEVTYLPMDADEYKKKSDAGEDVYSTFVLEDGQKNVSAGDYAVIVVVTERKNQVPAVPKNAIQKDNDGSFVYRLEEGRRVYTRVEKGLSDGMYTEILTGLSEGDEIYVDSTYEEPGEKIQILEKGTFSGTFDEVGALFYPDRTNVTIEIENGTVYFTEFQIDLYASVKKGDVIASVRVEPDPLEQERRTLQVQRLTDRYHDLEARTDASKEEGQKMLASAMEELEEAQESLDQLLADYSCTEIVAPAAGIVVSAEELTAEKQLAYGQRIAEIADPDRGYIVVSDKNHQLQYGSSARIAYQDRKGKNQTADGVVAGITGRGAAKELQSEYSILAVSREDCIRMIAPPVTVHGWESVYRYRVNAKIRSMDQVVLVPKSAAIVSGTTTYVYVETETGDKKLVPFVSGGSNDSWYWVVEGLSEGMKICLK